MAIEGIGKAHAFNGHTVSPTKISEKDFSGQRYYFARVCCHSSQLTMPPSGLGESGNMAINSSEC